MTAVLRPTDLDRKELAKLKVCAAQLADDGADYSGVTVKKPWGFEREIYKTDECCAWRLSIDPRSETSMHCHVRKTAIVFLSQGGAIIETLSARHPMGPGDMLVIEPGVFHRLKTICGATLIEVESPPNRRDLVRLEDRNGRGQGYEVDMRGADAAACKRVEALRRI